MLPAPRTRIAAALLCVYVIWGSTYLAIRCAIDSLPPLTMAGARFVIAGAIMWALARPRAARGPSRREWGSAALVGGLMLLGGNGGVCWAELHVPSGLASIFIGTVPLWAALFDWIRPRGRRPTAAVAAGLLIGFAGVALLTAGRGSGPALHLTGSAVLLFAAASWAAGSIAARQLPLPESPFLATAAEMLAGGALLLAAGAVTGEWRSLDPGGVTPASLAAAAYLVVFGSLAGFTAFVWLLRVTTPAVATSYAYVNPLVALFLGWVFLGEELTARTGVAAAVILAAVALITMGSVARATAEEKYRDARQAGEQAERSNARADDRGRDRLPD